MKKIISLLCSAAIVALSLAGCSKNETPEQGQQAVGVEKTVSFNANTPSTKSYFGDKTSSGYPTVWTANTKVGISVNYSTPKDAVVTPVGTGNKATFNATVTQPTGASEYVFYAVSPSSVVVSGNSTHSSFLLDIPTSQSPTKGSVDEAAHIMFAQSAALTTWPAEGTTVNLDFSHLAAYGKFTLENFREDGTSGKVKVNSVNIESDSVIAGRFYYYPAANHFSPNPASNVVTVNTENIEYTHNNSDLTIWFAIRPVDLKGSNMKITLNTTDGTFEKTFKFPVDKGTFKSGKVGSFVIDMDGIGPKQDEVYTLVTDYNVLKEDAKVIIAAAEADYAISTNQQTNNRAGAGVTKTTENSVSVIKNPASDVQIFVLEQGTKSNTVAFNCENGAKAGLYIGSPYLATSSTTAGNYLRSLDGSSDEFTAGNCSFDVDLVHLSDNNLDYAVLTANSAGEQNYMRFNAGSSNIFSLYKESSSVTGKVALYVLNGSGTGDALIHKDPKVATPEITFNSATNEVTITCATAGALIGYTDDGTDPQADNSGPIGTTKAYTGPFPISQTTTIKAFAGGLSGYENSDIATKECVVGGGDGTLDNPYSASEAAALALAEPPTSEVYVKGIISSIATAYSSQHNNVSFWISEDGTANTFQIYRASATSEDDFKVGDFVVFKGTLTKYNTTPELAEGSTLITQVKAPVFSPDGGIFTGAQNVTLTADAGATIYYTTDGSTPTTSSAVYSSAIAVNSTTTIKAFAVKGEISTGVVSKTFTINSEANDGSAEKPYTASEAAQLALGGSTASNVHVKGIISSIVYPWNSSSNNTSFWISEDGTANTFEIYKTAASSADDFKVGDYVVFKGTLTKYNTTPEMAEGSTLVTQVKAPVFTPDGGSFTTSSQNVTLTADAGATIYYTTDGSAPTTSSAVYSSAINLTATTTIKAFAVKDGKASGIISRTFTKQSSSSVTVTLTVGTNGNTTWSNGTKTTSATVGDVTFTALGGGGNDGKYYSSDNTWRFYASSAGSGVKITVPSDKKITSVVLTWKTGIPATPSGFTASGTTSPTTYVANSGTQVSEVSFIRGSANLLVQAITVTYE